MSKPKYKKVYPMYAQRYMKAVPQKNAEVTEGGYIIDGQFRPKDEVFESKKQYVQGIMFFVGELIKEIE